MDSVVVHEQLSYNRFPMEGAFVGIGLSIPCHVLPSVQGSHFKD